MNIYFIRHGDAERPSSSTNDFDRKLTKEGKNSLKIAAVKWKDIIHSFDYIVTSPLVRAVQTAKIIAEVFDYEDEIIKDDKLAGGGKTEDIIEIANALDGENIAFIGHQPDFSHYVSDLISINGAHIEFKKAAIAKIYFHNRMELTKGMLELLIPPAILR
ncbi:MAG: phosphohistidine phosphatase SixA [Ignavibacteriaceae bacterium]